jgi:hypothetical protein
MSEKSAKTKTTKSSHSSSLKKSQSKKSRSFRPDDTITREQMIGMLIFFVVITIASSYAFMTTFSLNF